MNRVNKAFQSLVEKAPARKLCPGKSKIKTILALLASFALLFGMAPAFAETITMAGKVEQIEKFGHARLDISIEDFNNAGFALGDIVTVSAGSYEGDMPYINGYYVERGDYMLRAFPGDAAIAVCINYGKFAETAGLEVGDPVTITLKEPAGALTLQEVNNLVYSGNRGDYASDEAFINFRAIVDGKLYRSASPADNQFGQAQIADALIRKAGIRCVMNMESTEEELAAYFASDHFASPYYKALYDAGKVIVLGMPVNFASDEFGEGIVKGLSFLHENEGPYLIHCGKGKDRAAFAAMLLEMLIGWNAEDILADYMQSYINYYSLEPGTEKYNLIVERDIKEMMRSVAGLEKGASPDGIDWSAAAEQYLLFHGMSETAVAALKANLIEEASNRQ